MKKFICEECGRVFTEDSAEFNLRKEKEEIWGAVTSWEEEYMCCPDCGSESYTEDYENEYEDGDICKEL